MGGLDKISMQYHSSDLPRLSLQSNELQFGAMTFFAKEHKDETCGSNGLPLTPNSIIIFGRAQILKSIKSPFLCEYLDIVRSKHERAIVVSQYCGEPLANYLNKNKFSFENIKQIAFQILLGLAEIHDMNIVHRNLSKENILLQNNMDIKLFNYGLFHMTDQGRLVSFPIVKPLYAAPEILLERSNNNFSNPKMDIWSLGMILTELVLDKPLWNTLKLGQCIRKIISLIHGSSSVLERIIREHNCYEKYEAIPKDLRLLIEDCLNVSPNNRPSSKDLLEKQMFKELKNELFVNKNKKTCKSFKTFTLTELYYWWKLAGGDVFLELKNQGLIRSTPPILSFPDMVLMDGTILGQGRDPATLYEPRIIKMPLDALYQRFSHIPFSNYYPLIHSQSAIINKFEAPLYNAFDLPLIIREKDPEYQFHRTILFRRLLHGYPFTRDQIVKQAKLDIPPLLRGDIWAAMLNVRDNEEYKKIDKETSTITDRQIEVDIPRCHQYNELLSSSVGHLKLKRILKAWISKNVEYVYWQGLDSLTAPFLYLNFNYEAKAFACLSAFIPKYLHNFFLKDNSVIIQEYLTKFSQLIAFHDPVLANHLQAINFVPELFAIPWFLTMFSHVFPLHKIFHLWDKLLLGDSSFPLHVGLSILTQLRDTLLKSGFNECILLFSDLPEVDIELCVGYSLETYKSTPQSITMRASQDNKNTPESHIAELAMQELTREKCPYISVSDVIDLITNHSSQTILIDIRNSVQFNRSCIKSSINIPYSSVAFGEANLDSLGTHSELLQDTQKNIVVVIGSFETDLELFPKFLLKCNVPKVCVLYGGFNVLLSNVSNTFITHNQT